MTQTEARFWAKVNKSPDCWTWSGCLTKFGYGNVKRPGFTLAHRYSWTLAFGPIPDGACVLHRCDNPPCVRPDHLFLGTKADNTADAMSKGRLVAPPCRTGADHWTRHRPDRIARGDRHVSRTHPELLIRGEQSPFAKLTDEVVRACRVANASGETITNLARQRGVSLQAMHRAVRRVGWRHVS